MLRSASILVGGTGASQILAVITLPFLTRIYSPEEFSQLASYTALLMILGGIACLKFEIAIPLATKEEDAVNLLVIALFIATTMSFLLALLLALWGTSLLEFLGQSDLAQYQWLIPFGVWFMGGYAAVQYWGTRKKWFKRIALTRFTQVVSGVSAQLAFGLSGLGTLGLLLGYTLMSGAGIFSLGRHIRTSWATLGRHVDGVKMRDLIAQYRRFPTYAVFESLANNGSQQIPILIIAALALSPEAGFVLLAMRTLGMPLNLIGSAVGQVYLSQAPEELERGNLARFTMKTVGLLALAGIPLMLIVIVVAPTAFSLVFGAEWQRAGELVVWMSPWFLLRLCSTPISFVMHVRMMQDRLLLLTLFGLSLRVGIVVFVHWYLGGYSAEAYAISGAIFYAIALLIFCNTAGVFVSPKK